LDAGRTKGRFAGASASSWRPVACCRVDDRQTRRPVGLLFTEKLADRDGPEKRLKLGDALVQSLMERAEMISMLSKSQGAVLDSLQGINGIDDVENR
jgi:hypothetical protein